MTDLNRSCSTVLDFLVPLEELSYQIDSSFKNLLCKIKTHSFQSRYFDTLLDNTDKLNYIKLPLLRHYVINEQAELAFTSAINHCSLLQLKEAPTSQSDFPLIFIKNEAWLANCSKSFSLPESKEQELCKIINAKEIELSSVKQILQLKLENWDITIDTKSPLAHLIINTKENYCPLSDFEISNMSSSIETALNEISCLWPEFGSSIKNRISLFVLTKKKKLDGHLDVRRGASFPQFPGLIFMSNYHREDTPMSLLMENIIHESVHNMLFEIELDKPWYSTEKLDFLNFLTVPSIFSNRTLPFYSFFHSLIVFSSLFHWFTLRSQHSDSEYERKMKEKIKIDFRKINSKDYGLILNSDNLSNFGQKLVETLVFPLI